jgi:GxxExxY protein
MAQDLPFAGEVHRVSGAAMEAHGPLGAVFLEAVDEEALAIEMRKSGIPDRVHVPMEIHCRDHVPKTHCVCDFLAFDGLRLEIKAIPQLTKVETARILDNRRATGREVGHLTNFDESGKLEWPRFAGQAQLNPS